VEQTFGTPLALIDDTRAACNVNITPPGGAYRWHYDRNAVTALLYLNRVAGGETDLYPHYRLAAPFNSQLQRGLDRILLTRAARRLLGHGLTIAPAPGTLVVIRGDRTLHSVRPVTGYHDRINLVIAYDRPGCANQQPALDRYLYDPALPEPTAAADAGAYLLTVQLDWGDALTRLLTFDGLSRTGRD
jgi:hypothetical protein